MTGRCPAVGWDPEFDPDPPLLFWFLLFLLLGSSSLLLELSSMPLSLATVVDFLRFLVEVLEAFTLPSDFRFVVVLLIDFVLSARE